MTWNEYLSLAERKLAEAGVEDARTNVEYLAAHVLGYKNRSEIRNSLSLDIVTKEVNEFESLLERRITREPLQYILGEWEFYGIPIKLNSSVLIPRPETEMLVEQALEEAKKYSGTDSTIGATGISILDIGTGSGCIAVALAKHLPSVKILGIDKSEEAVELARSNTDMSFPRRRESILEVRVSDIFSHGWETSKEKFDFIVSNPPYVSQKDFELLEPELRLFEPRAALTDNADGLTFYKRIADVALNLLRTNGCVIMELGFGMAEDVTQIIRQTGLDVLRIKNDLSGIPRVIVAKRRD